MSFFVQFDMLLTDFHIISCYFHPFSLLHENVKTIGKTSGKISDIISTVSVKILSRQKVNGTF